MTPRVLRRSSAGRRPAATALVAIALAAGLSACDSGGGGAGKAKAPVTPPPPAVRAAPPRSFLEKLIPPPGGILPAARVPGQIRRLVAALPVDRKVAQLLLVGFDGRDASAPFLSTLRGIDVGGVVVEQRNYNGAAALGSLTGAIRSATAGRSHEAPLILAPQEGGQTPRARPARSSDSGSTACSRRTPTLALRAAPIRSVHAPTPTTPAR
ncbi:MAG: hypothetical protein E6G07_03400 [Actinobacteria bacterium]|nr:MAG: hypothetical protein E6G07_03400 [Actinomycetota bacterium]